MSKKVWSFSTAVRNPERLRSFLLTLQEMEGKTWDKSTQLEFQARLIKNRFYGYDSLQFYSNLSKDIVSKIEDLSYELDLDEAMKIFLSKNYKDPSMRGRQSFKPLQKLGFVKLVDKKIVITSLGKYFLSKEYDLGEVFFKSLLKWQYPNPVDRDFSDANYNIKPFLATLHLIKKVNDISKQRNQKAKGISKLEFEIFAQSLLHFKNIDAQAKALLDFREELQNKKTYKEKQAFIEDFKNIFLSSYTNIDNLKDYADNTLRYFRLTRLLYIRGGGYYIDLEPRREIEIEELLKSFDASCDNFSKKEYIEYLSSIELPKLPWEKEDTLLMILNNLKNDIYKLGGELPKLSDDIKNDIKLLRELRHSLQDKKQKDILDFDSVIDALKDIRKQDLKPSIALEKYVTQAFILINDAINIKPNSLRGDDGEYIFTAPANRPDIECFYKHYNTICEVTMLTGRNQWHNEGQPVMRHFRDFEDSSSKDKNFCIFIAPKLHRDTINTFWIALKYEFEGKQQDIIPLTINQLISILEIVKIKKDFSSKELVKLFTDIVNIKKYADSSQKWLESIPTQIENFKRTLL